MVRNYRNESFSIKIDEGTGPIIYTCATEKIFESFKRDCIVKIILPEVADPENKNPKMPVTKQEVSSNVGAADFIVARTFIQADELLKGLHLESHIDRNKILDMLRGCRNHLIAAYNISCSLSLNIYHEALTYENKSATSEKIAKIPQIDDLENKAHNFLGSIKLALQEFANVLNVIFDTNLKGPRYDKIRDHFIKALGKEHSFSKLLIEAQEIITVLIDRRNAVEHPKPHDKLEVFNFEIGPDGVIPPTWLHEPTGTRTLITGDMAMMLNWVVEFIESATAHSLLEKTEGPVGYQIQLIPEERRNVDCPTRYKVGYIFPDGFPAPPSSNPKE